jgi:hypothetical protein
MSRKGKEMHGRERKGTENDMKKRESRHVGMYVCMYVRSHFGSRHFAQVGNCWRLLQGLCPESLRSLPVLGRSRSLLEVVSFCATLILSEVQVISRGWSHGRSSLLLVIFARVGLPRRAPSPLELPLSSPVFPEGGNCVYLSLIELLATPLGVCTR